MNVNETTDFDPNLTSQTEFAARKFDNKERMSQNNLLGTLSDIANDTANKLIVAEEFPEEDYFNKQYNINNLSIGDEDFSLGEEKLIWMNYSIKNMNEKIKLFSRR